MTKPIRPSTTPDPTKVARISPETMKRYRVETCYFGAMGIRVARDAYLASMKDVTPSEGHLPEFGDYPDPNPKAMEARPEKTDETDKPAKGPKADMKGDRKPMRGARQLPFIRHVRACSIAKSLKVPAYEGFDAELAEFDGYVSEVQKLLLDATRYYGREQYKKDDFARGKVIDERLKTLLPELDAKLDKFGKAVEAWYPTAKRGDEKLDDAAKASVDAVAEARKIAVALLADPPDAEAAKAGVEALEQKRADIEKAREADAAAPHPRVMLPRIEAFVAAAKSGMDKGGALDAASAGALADAMANLIEADQRGLAQLIRRSSGGGGRGMMGGHGRPRLRGDDDKLRAIRRPGGEPTPPAPPAPPDAPEPQ